MPDNSAAVGEQPEVALGLVPGATEPAPSTEAATQPEAAPVEGQPPPEDWRAAHPELAAKFADASKLAAAYAHLERRFHAITQLGYTPEQAADLLAGVSAPPGGEASGEEEGYGLPEEGTVGSAPEVSTDPSAFLDRFAANPVDALQPLIDQRVQVAVSAMIAAQEMWSQAKSRYPDITKHEREMTRVLQAAPGLAQFPDVIDRIYRMVAGGATPEAAIAAAKSEAREAAIRQVTGTIVESGRTGGSPTSAAGKSAAEVVVDEIFGVGSGTSPTLRRLE